MLKHLKNNLGYTLVEIVTTTAIVGALTAVAVPNFMRVKMNVNMEMVKQHLRIMGQNMNELYNQSSSHQYPENIDALGDSPEEVAITASLSAIRGMGYDIIHQGGPSFMDRATPMPGMFGIAGTDCFYGDPLGVRKLDNCYDPEGISMSIINGGALTPRIFNAILTDPTLSESEKVSLLSGMLIQMGLYSDYYSQHIDELSMQMAYAGLLFEITGFPSFFASMDAQNQAAFDQLKSQIASHLQESGIHVYLGDYETLELLPSQVTNVELSGFKVAVQFDQAPEYSSDWAMFNLNFTSTYSNHPDAMAYKNVYQQLLGNFTIQNEGPINDTQINDGFYVGEGCYHCSA